MRNIPDFISSDLDIPIQSQINLLFDVSLDLQKVFFWKKKTHTHNLRKPEEFVQQTGARDELLMTSPRRTWACLLQQEGLTEAGFHTCCRNYSHIKLIVVITHRSCTCVFLYRLMDRSILLSAWFVGGKIFEGRRDAIEIKWRERQTDEEEEKTGWETWKKKTSLVFSEQEQMQMY